MKINLPMVVFAHLVLLTSVSAETQCQEHPIRYEISYEGDKLFHVAIKISPLQNSMQIYSYENVAGDKRTDDFFQNVTIFSKEIGEAALSQDEPGVWIIPDQYLGRDSVIHYQVSASHEQTQWPFGKEEIAHKFDDGYYFVGYTLLLGDMKNDSCKITVSVSLPEKWRLITPWTKIAPRLFEVHSVVQLQRNGMVFGPDIGTFTTNVGERIFTFVYESELVATAKSAQSAASTLSKYYAQVFGGAPESDYYIFMMSGASPDGGAFSDSFAQRFITPVRPAEKIVWLHGFAHELAHRWMGIGIQFESNTDLEWFKEGVTDYLTIKGLFATGEISENEMGKKLENIIRRYMLALRFGGPQSFAEAGHNKSSNGMLIYGGGAVFALLLDAEMAAQHSAGSFENVLAELYKGRDTPYSYRVLLDIMNASSGGEAGAILANLEKGVRADELAIMLAPHGIQMASFMEEVYISFDATECGRRRATCPPVFLMDPIAFEE